MAGEGFKIADGFIAVYAEVDKSSTTRAANKIADDVDEVGRRVLGKKKGFGDGISKSLLGSLGALGDVGGQLASSVSSGFSKVLPSALAPIAGPALLLLIPTAVAAAVVVGSAIAGGIVAGISTGVVGAGIALALKDSVIADAVEDLKTDVSKGFLGAAESFIEPTKAAVYLIRGAFADILPDIRDIFKSASGYVTPLVNGMLGLVRNVLPGIKTLVSSAKPVIEVLQRMLPRIGTAISEAFKDISGNSNNAAAGLQYVLTIVEKGIIAFGEFTGFVLGFFDNLVSGALTSAKAMEAAWGWLPVVGGKLQDNIKTLEELKAVTDGTASSSDNLSDGLQGIVDTSSAAARETAKLNAAIKGLNDITLSANDAERNFQAAIDNATESIKGKVREIDLGTEKGRIYSAALDEIATSAYATAQATFNQTGSQEAANRKFEEGRQALIRTAMQMGLSRDAATTYANSVMRIPTQWETTVDADTAEAIKKINEAKARYDLLKNKNIKVTAEVYWTSSGDLHMPGGTTLKNAKGGLIEGPGTGTSDSIPSMLSNGEYVINAAAVNKLGIGTLDAINAGKMPSTSTASAGKTGIGVMVQNLIVNIQGVWDLSKPFPREAAYKVNEAITNLSREYA